MCTGPSKKCLACPSYTLMKSGSHDGMNDHNVVHEHVPSLVQGMVFVGCSGKRDSFCFFRRARLLLAPQRRRDEARSARARTQLGAPPTAQTRLRTRWLNGMPLDATTGTKGGRSGLRLALDRLRSIAPRRAQRGKRAPAPQTPRRGVGSARQKPSAPSNIAHHAPCCCRGHQAYIRAPLCNALKD